MPVTVEKEELEPCKVALDIHVPAEDVQRVMDTVFHQFAKRVAVPGFRKGKAPRRLAEKYVDPDMVKEAALEKLIESGFKQALQQTGIQPYNQASVQTTEFLEDAAFRFKATVPLKPDVQLGEYRGLQAKRMQVAITEGDIDRELARVREQAARYEEVQEPAREGDRLQAGVRVTVEGEAVPEATHESAWLLVGGNFPEFDRGLIGVSPGEEKTFSFTYPAEMEDERAGKTADAWIAAKRVQRQIVPDLNDEFAQSLGHDTLDALRAEIRENLESQASRQADDFLDRDLVEQAVRAATVHYPPDMVDEEVAGRMDSLIKSLENRGLKLEDYLQSVGKDLAGLEQELADESRRQIRNTLVLIRIAQENEIHLEEADIEAEVARRAEANRADVTMIRRLLEEQGEMDALRNQVFFRKVLNFLKSVSQITEAA